MRCVAECRIVSREMDGSGLSDSSDKNSTRLPACRLDPQQLRFSCRRSGFWVPGIPKPRRQLIHARNGSLPADIVKALDTISAEHDINEPFDPGEIVSLYLKDTNPPRDTRDAVSRCFRLRPDIPHFCA